MKIPLTPKQKKTLDYLSSFSEKRGYMPSLKEISDHFNIAIVSAYERIRHLENKGRIQKTKGRPREIIIL